MVPLPLDQPRVALAVLVQQLPVQLQPRVSQAVHVDRRQPQHVLPALQALLVGETRQPDLRCVHEGVVHGQIRVQRDQGAPPSHQHREAVIGARAVLAQLRGADLLPEEQAGGHLGALTEAEQADPFARGALTVIVAHGGVQGFFNHGNGELGVDAGVLGAGAEPPAKGAVFSVDGDNVWAGLRGEGGFGEAEAEFSFEFGSEDSTLGAEDSGVCATAMEAEYSGEIERSIFGFWRDYDSHDEGVCPILGGTLRIGMVLNNVFKKKRESSRRQYRESTKELEKDE